MRRLRQARGQASIELVALLPVLALVCGVLWQAVLAGQALWLSASAARAGARAQAIGYDVQTAARAALPRALARGASADVHADGSVTVRIHVPAVVGSGVVGTVAATAAMAKQR